MIQIPYTLAPRPYMHVVPRVFKCTFSGWIQSSSLWWLQILKFGDPASCSDVNDSSALERDFRELVARENSTISKICFAYAGSIADFEDLRQDALINLWRGMQTFRGESSQRTWIYRIVVNSCLSTIRKQRRHQHEGLEALYGAMAEEDGTREAIETMHKVIGQLGLQEQAIIMMWLDEMSYDDIAEAMGINRNTVASRLRRVKEKIAKLYNHES